MAYDSVRAQLDKLLGPDRNGPLTTTSSASADYHHPEICKHYLLGFCPADLHIKHRSEPGSCKHRHSDSAKAAFQRDLAAQRVTRENARWRASMLSECRTIIADEDRKVRCHARRLKETYNVQGDLKGLMIMNFDTLKELGMVRNNARIPVSNETGGEELNSDLAPTEAVGHACAPSAEYGASPVSHANLPPSVGGRHGNASSTNGHDAHANRQSHHCHYPRETDDDNSVLGEGDDDGDFGLIKVIPAPNVTNGSPKKIRDESDRHAPEQIRDANPAIHEKDRPVHCASPVTKATEAETRQGSPAKPNVRCNAAVKDTGNLDGTLGSNRVGSSSNGGVSSLCDIPGMRKDGSKIREGELDVMTTSNRMDFFYDRGVGPNGLLMLDKKQSLRVCACCGGYISLADAESRLLSHYGGKSHHSMALLRQKVQQLEAEVSAETRSSKFCSSQHARLDSQKPLHNKEDVTTEENPLRFRHAKSPEKHNNRYGSKRSDRYDDRRKARYRKDSRGYGTSDWYNNYRSEKAEDYSSKWSESHRSPVVSSSQHHQERWYGRKRHRSRSPQARDLRRTQRR